jgi:GntR family transcriptional repressor for pyruvate dehydrogenase complex
MPGVGSIDRGARRPRSGTHEAFECRHNRGGLLGRGGRGDQLQARATVRHWGILTQRRATRSAGAGGGGRGATVPNTGTLRQVPSPIPRQSVPDHVFERLREAILAGEYRPGDRLPSQRALAADLDVNMSTVREALGRLEQLRLVEVRHGNATRVLDWRKSGGLESLVLQSGNDAPLLGDLFEARRLLLAESARLAAQRRSQTQAESLRALARAAAEAEDRQTALLADWAFMEALVEAADNLIFQLVMNSVRELYLPRVEAFAALVSNPEELAPLYVQAAAAIDARDGEAAGLAIERLAGLQEARIG